MDSNRLKPIQEASYLTAENAWRYRAILHYFYIQHERLRQYLFPEDVYAYLREDGHFRDYTEEQLQYDLKQLVEWRNLIPRQETGRVLSIEDFKRKKFRYQCTPYTIEIERMVEKLHEIGNSFGGSLETTLFDRLLRSLRRFVEVASRTDDAELHQAWEEVYEAFRKIVQSASDYLAHLKSEKVEERMMTEAFLVYKDAFADYLRKFMLGLQHASFNTETVLRGFSTERFQAAAERIADYQLTIPRLEERRERILLIERTIDQWTSLNEWFLGSAGRTSELAALENETTETIRRITRFAQRLGERQQTTRSRYRDYLHLAGWFARLDEVRGAHKLSALLFGVSHIRHIFAEASESDDMNRSLWHDSPTVVTVKPRVSAYREKSRPSAVVSRSAEKAALLAQYLAEKQREQRLLEALIIDGRIVFGSLPVQEARIRKILLGWVGRCMASSDRTVKTETGQTAKLLLLSDKTVSLACEDGILQMPDYALEFGG